MNKRVTYRGIEKNDILENHINKHFEKIEALLTKEHGPFKIDITLEVHKPAEQKSVVHIHSPVIEAYASATTNDIFSSIIEVMNRVMTQIREGKRRLVTHHHKGCGGECRTNHMEKPRRVPEFIDDEVKTVEFEGEIEEFIEEQDEKKLKGK